MDRQKTTHALRQKSLSKQGTKEVVLGKAIHRKRPTSRRKVQLPTTSELRSQPAILAGGQLRPLLPTPTSVVIRSGSEMDISQPSLGNPDPKLQQKYANNMDFDPPHHLSLAETSNTATSSQVGVYSILGFSEPLIPEMSGATHGFPPAALLPNVGNDMSMHTMLMGWNPVTCIEDQSTASPLCSLPQSLPLEANFSLDTRQTTQHDPTRLRHCPSCSLLWRKLRDSIMGIIRLQEGVRGGTSVVVDTVDRMPEKLTTELLGNFFAFGDHWQDFHAGRAGESGPE